jgi:hypothetical protein
MDDASLVGLLSGSREEGWDLDDSMPDDRLWASPIGRFVAGVRDSSHTPRAMRLLALFAARRAVACWLLYCDGTTPIECIQATERVLDGDSPVSDLRPFLAPAVPSYQGEPIVDCRACDTGCAADAIAHMARLFAEGDPRELALCLSSADMAFDQSPLVRRDQFRQWLIEVAVPAALDERKLTEEEQARFRDYSLADLVVDRDGA